MSEELLKVKMNEKQNGGLIRTDVIFYFNLFNPKLKSATAF